MFRFNFGKEDDATDDVTPATEAASKAAGVPCKECLEIVPSNEQYEKYGSLDPAFLNELQFDGNQSVLFFPVEQLIDDLKDESSDIQCTEENNSDVIPGVYEGGAKIWECTHDLANVLTRIPENEKSLAQAFANKTVLDLGCGAGILGILALNAGAVVHFQDYNDSILKHVTIPNVIVNVEDYESVLIKQCKFFSGDWENYVQKVGDQLKFDYILTSETIYNPNNYGKLMNVFKTKLKSDGVIYLAAKTVYFGVGGSVKQFIDTLNKDGTFESKIVHSIKDNVFRDVLEIKFVSQS